MAIFPGSGWLPGVRLDGSRPLACQDFSFKKTGIIARYYLLLLCNNPRKF
jgi:hypothetical protein